MTPTPEVEERARALRKAVGLEVTRVGCRATDGVTPARTLLDEGTDLVLRAIVTELGITQEQADTLYEVLYEHVDPSLALELAPLWEGVCTLLAAAGGE